MPKFIIATEEVIKTIRSYRVEAETLEEALNKLEEASAEKFLFEEYERSNVEEVVCAVVEE